MGQLQGFKNKLLIDLKQVGLWPTKPKTLVCKHTRTSSAHKGPFKKGADHRGCLVRCPFWRRAGGERDQSNPCTFTDCLPERVSKARHMHSSPSCKLITLIFWGFLKLLVSNTVFLAIGFPSQEPIPVYETGPGLTVDLCDLCRSGFNCWVSIEMLKFELFI